MAKMSSITDCLMFAIVLLVATTLFIFHSLTILSRYWGNSVTETVHSVRNSSLILPVVHMQFETQRQSPVPNETVFQTMHFKAQLDDRELPFWASPVKHTEFRSQSANGWYHSITVNRISMKARNIIMCKERLKNPSVMCKKHLMRSPQPHRRILENFRKYIFHAKISTKCLMEISMIP